MSDKSERKTFKPRPQAVGPLIARMLDPIAKKRGFSTAEILLRWESVVGSSLAAVTRPEKVMWPRSGEGESGGTLHLFVRPAASLDVRHAAPQIMERINGMLGWGAIRALKIRQTPLGWTAMRRPVRPLAASPERARALDEKLAGIEDQALRASLRSLGLAALRPLDKP